MVYVLKGWFETEMEGHGRHRMTQGSCWIQPPGIATRCTAGRTDCELLEIVLPADFETVVDP
jgi:hypothetical protein